MRELKLKNDLDSELNFSRRRGRSGQQTRHPSICSRGIKNVGVVGSRWWSKVGMIDNVKDLRAELQVEIFGNSLDAVILEHREVQGCDARADQDVATGVAAEVETS